MNFDYLDISEYSKELYNIVSIGYSYEHMKNFIGCIRYLDGKMIYFLR